MVCNEIMFQYFHVVAISALVVLTLSKHVFKCSMWRCFFYYIIMLLSFFLVVGAGGVMNDAYKRLEIFEELEKNNQLQNAKDNPTLYDRMLQIDLKCFANSQEFKEDLFFQEETLVLQGYIIVGVLFAIMFDFFLKPLVRIVKKFWGYNKKPHKH